LWNIHGGTNTKLSSSSHIQRLFDDLDVVALIETHLFLDETPLHMLGFQCLHNPRPVFDMSSVRATMKHSGGVAVTHGQTVYPYGNRPHMAPGCGYSSSAQGLHCCFLL
jgi:hypothetical protein